MRRRWEGESLKGEGAVTGGEKGTGDSMALRRRRKVRVEGDENFQREICSLFAGKKLCFMVAT